MKTKLILFFVLFGLIVACKRGPNAKCGTCPDFSRKDYLKKK